MHNNGVVFGHLLHCYILPEIFFKNNVTLQYYQYCNLVDLGQLLH